MVTSEIPTDCPESSDYVTTWMIKYKSDKYDIYGYIAIPNDFLMKKSSYPCVIYNLMKAAGKDISSIKEWFNL